MVNSITIKYINYRYSLIIQQFKGYIKYLQLIKAEFINQSKQIKNHWLSHFNFALPSSPKIF